MSAPLVTHALRAAEAGFSVFPLRPLSKTPRIARWPEKSTYDLATVERWWSKWPDANIAIDTDASGLLVVDLDVDSDGSLDPALDEWRAYAGDLTSPTAVSTPSGGRHLYFSDTAARFRNSVKKIGAHVDIRAAGGYVVAPGSVLPSGVYRWA